MVTRVLLGVIGMLALVPIDAVRQCKAEPPRDAPPAPAAAGQTPAGAPAQDADAARRQAVLNTRTAVGPYTEKTSVDGKIPIDITGTWLVVTHTRPSPKDAPDKFQSFVQLMKITDGATPHPTFHMLDVQLPAPIQSEIDSSMHALTPWNPKPEQLATLKKTWSSLAPFKDKNLMQQIFLSIDYTLIAPDQYKTSLTQIPSEFLDGSTFALRVAERYRPGEVPNDPSINVGQLMGRDSLYSFKATGSHPAQLNGGALVKFTAAGAGFPLPLGFGGSVQMYKLGN